MLTMFSMKLKEVNELLLFLIVELPHNLLHMFLFLGEKWLLNKHAYYLKKCSIELEQTSQASKPTHGNPMLPLYAFSATTQFI